MYQYVTFSTSNILFINVWKQNTKGKYQNTFKFACLELFKVVAKVASFVGNPVSNTLDLAFTDFMNLRDFL